METPLHRAQMALLIELTNIHWQSRTDYYVGGNMFLYYKLYKRTFRTPEYYCYAPAGDHQLLGWRLHADAWPKKPPVSPKPRLVPPRPKLKSLNSKPNSPGCGGKHEIIYCGGR
jgi:hypothetical protein